MSGIGGLDVSFGARHQIIRTNVAIVNCDNSHYLTENAAKCVHDLLNQGLGGTILEPDFVCPIFNSLPGTGAWGSTLVAESTSIFDVDTTGNGTADSTTIAKGPLLRNLAQVPLSVNGAVHAASGAGAANNAGLTTTGGDAEVGNMVLEAILSTGVCQLGAAEGATTAFGASTPDGNELERITEFSGAVYSAAMASAYNGVESGDSHTAGTPEAQVGLLDFQPFGAALLETANQGGAAMPDFDTNHANITPIFDDFADNGRAQANAGSGKATFKNLMAATDAAQVFGLCVGIASVVSIAKVL